MAIIDLFLPKSIASSLPETTLRRVPFLLGVDVLLLIYFFVASFVRWRADPQVYLTFFIAVCVTEALFFLSMFLVRIGHFMVASYVGSAGVILDVLWVGLFLPFTASNDLYRFGVFLIAAIGANTMIAFERRQVWVFGGASILAFALFMAAIAVPKGGGMTGELLTAGLSLLLLIVGMNMIMLLMSGLNHRLLKLAEQEGVMANSKAYELAQLMQGARAALSTGQELLAAARDSRIASAEVRKSLASLAAEAGNLTAKAACADDDSTEALHRMNQAREAVDAQNLVIVDAGAGIERLAGSIQSLAELAESRRGSIAEAVTLAERQGKELRTVLDGMEGIRGSSERAIEAVGGILDISEKTQLLAMNASIEAAHAGVSGKGFAVIAGEVRKLSQEAQESTRRIGDAVKANAGVVRDQSSSLARFTTDIDTMIHDVRGTLDGLSEILDRLRKMSIDTVQLNDATGSMLHYARQTQDSVLGVVEGLESGAASAASTKDFACTMAERVEAILGDFAAVEAAVEKAESIGSRSLERLAEIEAVIERT